MIQKLLTNSSPTQKKIFGGVFLVVVIALFYFLLIEPAMKNLSKIDRDITLEQKMIRSDLRVLAEKTAIEEDIAKYKDYLSDDTSDEGVILSQFLKRVDDLAKRADVVVINKLPPKKTETDQPYLVYQGDFEANGKFEDIVEFIHTIETSQELFKVVKFNLAGKKGDATDEVKATLTIAKIIITSSAPENESPAEATDTKK